MEIKNWDNEALAARSTPLNGLIAKLPPYVRGVTFKVHEFVINNRELLLAGALFAVWAPQVFVVTAVVTGAFMAYEKVSGKQLFAEPIKHKAGNTEIAVGPHEAYLIAGVVGGAGLLLNIAFLEKASVAALFAMAMYSSKLPKSSMEMNHDQQSFQSDSE